MELLQLTILVLDLLLLRLDEFLLAFDLVRHIITLLVLLILVCLHMGLQVLLDLFHFVNLILLVLEQLPGLLEL